MHEDIQKVCGETNPLKLLFASGDVLRYHVLGRYGPSQTVSEHTWRVLVLVLHIWPDASRDLILAALYHDGAEHFTGDVPSTVKRVRADLGEALEALEDEFLKTLGFPSFSDLSSEDRLRLKCADTLECHITCMQARTVQSLAAAQRAADMLKGIIRESTVLPEEELRRVYLVMRMDW